MKRLILVLVAVACLGLVGCATKSHLEKLDTSITFNIDTKFVCDEVFDRSGFAFDDEDEKIVLADQMKAAMAAALSTAGIAGDEYAIKITILHYEPGNAFARWLLPGAGATELTVESVIYASDGRMLAKIPVERSIAAGGGYTIGAWKYVFDDVAEEIVTVIKEQLIGLKEESEKNISTVSLN